MTTTSLPAGARPDPEGAVLEAEPSSAARLFWEALARGDGEAARDIATGFTPPSVTTSSFPFGGGT